MRNPLNSPLEVGLRVLMILTEAYPTRFDINWLVLLDHNVLHTADLGGPESMHPSTPIQSGEIGVKRKMIEEGLQVMLRAGLVEVNTSEAEICFQASDDAYSFVSILASKYAAALRIRIRWVLDRVDSLSDESLREQMREIFGRWTPEFSGAFKLSTD